MKWLHGRSSGVFGADGNLSVTANGDMTVSVSDGVGWLANDKADGTVFWNDTKEQTGSELQLTIPLPDAILPRIDRIVVSWDTVNYAEKPRIEVLKGTPNNAPTATELTNNTLKRQISLARIYVAAAVSRISADSITDERLDPDVCGLVTDWVSVDTTTIQAQFSALLEKVKTELSQLHGGTAMMTKAQYDPSGGGLNVCVQEYECNKSGSVYALMGEGAVGRFKVPAAWSSGDTWTVNGVAVPAYCGADAADGDSVVTGRWVLFTFDGSRLDFNGGGGLSASKLAQATAADTDVLTGKKYYAGGKTIKEGKMPNRGSWGATLYPGGVATIPSGFHDGSGQVTAVSLKTVTITMATSYGDWVYTLPSGTLVGVSNIAASGNSSEIASLTISGNTVRVTWSGNGVINRQITLIYY
nr:MAG TPA: Receptor Binding Protein [Caudoviricetes sp.]